MAEASPQPTSSTYLPLIWQCCFTKFTLLLIQKLICLYLKYFIEHINLISLLDLPYFLT